MLTTTNHRLRQQSLTLESFLEAHEEVLSPALAEGVRELLEVLRADRRRLKAAERRVALREHEAAVARRRRRAAVAAVRGRMIRLRGLVSATYGPLGPRFLLSLRSAISRHPSTLAGQARRAVFALRLRAAAGVRLTLPAWEISPAPLAEGLESLERELAAAVTEGFRTSERLFAAQADRAILHQAALQRLREVRDAAWKASHAVRRPRLAARVRRMLGRKHGAFVRSLRTPCRGPAALVREPRKRGEGSLRRHRGSDTGVLGAWALVRGVGTGVLGSWTLAGGLDTGCVARLRRKMASAPAFRVAWWRWRAFSPGVWASRHFSPPGWSLGCFRTISRSAGRLGRGPPGSLGVSNRHRTSLPSRDCSRRAGGALGC